MQGLLALDRPNVLNLEKQRDNQDQNLHFQYFLSFKVFVGVELRLDQTSCNFSSKWNCVAAEKIMFNFCEKKLNLIVWTTPVFNLINALL